MKKWLRIFALLCFCAALVAGFFAFQALQWMKKPQSIPEALQRLEIKKGESLYSLSRKLQAEGVLRWPQVWVQYAKFSEQTTIKKGEYALRDIESPLSILQKLNSGEVISYQLTLVEGMTLREFLARLQAHEKIKHTFSYDDVSAALASAGIELEHPEGWFYPDTYRFIAGDSDISILKRAHEKMKAVLQAEWETRDENLPYDSPYEALIMASIIEKETGVASERGEISGVFVRRLEKRMRLQTDPTVIYGMGENYSGNITHKDLRKPTPYNTYVISGLPPTPIANPGGDAIRAAMHPQPGESLYFVAKGDGSHHFSASLEEHNAAVVKYQKRRRQDYRSSPESLKKSGN